MTSEVLDQLADDLVACRLVAIVRVREHERVVDIAETLVAAGVRFLEVTVERPSGLDGLRRTVDALGARAVVGAGTVLSPAMVTRVADVGARFVVTPNVDDDVLAASHERGLLALPGAFTPSEVARASRAGARLVKLFPASTGGVAHLRALRGPFPEVRFVPTGGVTTDNASDWFAAGAVAVALGTNLVPADGSTDGLAERARLAVAATSSKDAPTNR